MKDYQYYGETQEYIGNLLSRRGSSINRLECRWIAVQHGGAVYGYLYTPKKEQGIWGPSRPDGKATFIGKIDDFHGKYNCNHVYTFADCANAKPYQPLNFDNYMDADTLLRVYQYLLRLSDVSLLKDRWLVISSQNIVYCVEGKPFLHNGEWTVPNKNGFFVGGVDAQFNYMRNRHENWIWSRISLKDVEWQLKAKNMIDKFTIHPELYQHLRCEVEIEVDNEIDAKIKAIEAEIVRTSAMLDGLSEELAILKKAREILGM